MHELLARVEALLRRSRTTAAANTTELPTAFAFGPAQIDRQRYTVAFDGRTQPLTARELKRAETFAAQPGEVLSRDALLNAVWGVDYFGTTRTLDQHVAQLRRKIGSREGEGPIVTVYGVGYRYEGECRVWRLQRKLH